jgi:hypothetical protein
MIIKNNSKIIITTLILTILVLLFFIIKPIAEKPLILTSFSRTIEPAENVNIKTYESFKSKVVGLKSEYFQNFCKGNTNTLNDERLRQIYGVENVADYYDTFRGSNFIASSFTLDNDVLNCYSYKTIKPKEISKPVTQVYIKSSIYRTDNEIKKICESQLNKINKNIKTFDHFTIDIPSVKYLTICESSD